MLITRRLSLLRLVNDIEIALRNAHFRYRGSIEYRDTRDGIVIVVPISGIAQHYMGPFRFCVALLHLCRVLRYHMGPFRPRDPLLSGGSVVVCAGSESGAYW